MSADNPETCGPRKRGAGDPRTAGVCSLGTAGLIVQLACIYFFTGLLKDHPIWRTEWSAVYYTLSIDHFATPLGRWLLQFPTLLQGLTLGALVLEVVGPVLLFCPWKNDWLRIAVVGGFVSFHLGLALTMELGFFPYICIAYWLVLLPGSFWEVGRKAVPYVSFLLRTGAVRKAATAGGGRLADSALDPSHPRREAATPDAGFACAPPQLTWAGNCLLAVLLAYVLLLNVARVSGTISAHLATGPVRMVGDAAQLNQFWCMFAPRPNVYGGWLSLTGELVDGTRVNLLRPELPPFDHQPAVVSATYPTERWRKCLMNLFERGELPGHRQRVGDFLVERWNATHGPREQLTAASIISYERATPPPRAAHSNTAATPHVLWQWTAETLASP